MKRDREWYRTYRATRQGPIPHGTHNAYVNYTCRCPECRDAHREHVADWRARRQKVSSPEMTHSQAVDNSESVTSRNDT